MIIIITWFFFVCGYMSFLNPLTLWANAVSVPEAVQIDVPGYLFENDMMVTYLASLMLEGIAKPYVDCDSNMLGYINEAFINERPFFKTNYNTFGMFLKNIVYTSGRALYPYLNAEQIFFSTLLGTLDKVYLDNEVFNTIDYYIMDWGTKFYGINMYDKNEALEFFFYCIENHNNLEIIRNV